MPEDAEVSQETGSQEPSTHVIGESAPIESQNLSDSAPKDNGETPARTPQQKRELSRYERTKRERAAFKAQREAFERERTVFALERAKFLEAQKPKRNYTLDELKGYRQAWEDEGNFDLVKRADKEIAAMEAEQQAERQSRTVELPPVGTPEHKAQWEAAERELAQADPEFMREGTPLDARLREIMGGPDGDIYRQHPRGIVAAYHRAKMELLEAGMKGLQTENSKLKTELQRYTGLTSLSGGAPAGIGNGNRVESISDFSKLSAKDMRKHLLRGAKRDGVPWF
jgi:hypothetical protein